MNAKIKVDVKGIEEMAMLLPKLKRQMPYVQSVALNEIGFKVHRGITRLMPSHYNKLRNYSKKPFRYKKAKRRNLIVTVGLDQSRSFLAPTIIGGRRKFKKAEGLLKGKSEGNLEQHIQLTPVKGGRTKKGDIRRSAIRKAIADMSTKNQRGGVFFGKPRGLANGKERDEGVWIRKRRGKWQKRKQRYAGKLQPLFKQSDPADYRPNTFPMFRLGKGIANRTAKAAFNHAFAKALQTTK